MCRKCGALVPYWKHSVNQPPLFLVQNVAQPEIASHDTKNVEATNNDQGNTEMYMNMIETARNGRLSALTHLRQRCAMTSDIAPSHTLPRVSARDIDVLFVSSRLR